MMRLLRTLNCLIWLLITPIMWPIFTLVINRKEFYQQMKMAWCHLRYVNHSQYEVSIKCRRARKDRRRK